MKNKGFTLIELLVVVLITGILAAVAACYAYKTNAEKDVNGRAVCRSICGKKLNSEDDPIADYCKI